MAGERVLVVDDELVVREGVRRILAQAEFAAETCSSGTLAIDLMQERDFDLLITDMKMPGLSGEDVLRAIRILQPDVPVIIITGYGCVEGAVEMMKAGAHDYIAKPFTPDLLLAKVAKALEHRAALIERLHPKCPGFDLFVGDSREMQKVYRRISQVSQTDSTVIVIGESGTGKELAARAIHKVSRRANRPFVGVDCTSLSENLLESELFGHVKGSFTGAVRTKTGLFQIADGGTLFLDEIANLSLHIQAKLLRVLEQRAVTPVGGTDLIPIDIRLIVATNRDLKDLLAEGLFREDLYFRLNIIPIQLPPLRERKGDLPALIGHFLETLSERVAKDIRGVSPEALALLEEYSFPGNVRELKNLIERAVVLADDDDLLRPVHLELHLAEGGFKRLDGHVPRRADELKETKKQIWEKTVEPVERAFVLSALQRNDWNITRAAEETGMVRQNFQALMKKLGITLREGVSRQLTQ